MASKNVAKDRTFEQLFPDQRGRRAIDEAIDAYEGDSIHECMERAEQAYFARTGTSPMRR